MIAIHTHTHVKTNNYVDMEAAAMDEPSADAESIPMMEVMSWGDAAFYESEAKLLEKGGTDKQVIKDLEKNMAELAGLALSI